jgi:hypothetical protein
MKPWRSLSSGERHRNRPGGGNPPRVVGVAGRAAETEAAMVSRALVSATGVVFVGWAASLRARAGTPCSLPAGAARVQRFRFGLQKVQETHGQLEALVAVHGIAPPALEEAVYEISQSTVVFARQYVVCEEELRAPAVEPLGKLLVQVLLVLEKLLARIHGSVIVPTNIGATKYLHM